jgi:hypothetical protein
MGSGLRRNDILEPTKKFRQLGAEELAAAPSEV